MNSGSMLAAWTRFFNRAHHKILFFYILVILPCSYVEFIRSFFLISKNKSFNTIVSLKLSFQMVKIIKSNLCTDTKLTHSIVLQ